MSSQHHIIRDTSDTLVEFFKDQFKGSGYKRVHIIVEAPKPETIEGKLPAVCLYLYQVSLDDEGLDSHVRQELIEIEGPDGLKGEFLRQVPMWIRCDYLLSTWAQEPEDEQLLIGMAIKAVMENPVLVGKQLKGDSFAENFELPLSLSTRLDEASLAHFWNSLNQPVRPAIQCWTSVPVHSDKMQPFRRVEERMIGYRDLTTRGSKKEIGPALPPDMPPSGKFVKRNG